jgi:YegS/Rv2252/BmrU family lipid kinase
LSSGTLTQAVPRIFVVLNPVAGSCTAEVVRAAFERHFAADVSYEIYETTGDEQLVDVVQKALKEDYQMVVAGGGDGTVSDVAEALAHSNIPLGIIPLGTANVLARELNIPIDLDGACALLIGEHATTSIDAMQVGEKLFVLQIGIGIDSLMIRDTGREDKRRFGRAAYIWTAFTRLLGYQPLRFSIAVDGKRLRPRASQVLIANGGVLGMPPFRWGPNIRPDDGRIDVCIVSAQTVLDYIGVAWHILRGQQKKDRRVRYLRAERSIAISADQPLPVQADGEIIGETPLQVQVIPDAIRVIVPTVPDAQTAEPMSVGVLT